MTAKRSDAVPDMYLYDIPIMERDNLCQILLKRNAWLALAEHMGYNTRDINEISSFSYDTNGKEANELLTRWGEQNHTITELFVLLSRIQQYAAMNTIKDLVDSRYHRLIGRSQLTEINVNECASMIPTIDYEMLCSATNNWSDQNVLGRGGFATVYKGMYKATAVAIKRIENRAKAATGMSKIQIKQILTELRISNSCRHDNILPLYGVSVNGEDPCLVYQLMQGGSLEQRLFKRSSNVPPLTWQQRINIVVGTARGLQFLHTFQDKPFIHGDIKPANILLDPNDQPKIGDFGLVREGNENETIVSRVYGTKPYLPAEFLLYRKLTTKVDSYSFGIMLFELSTGLRACDGNLYLIETIKSHSMNGTILELIDKTAGSVEDEIMIFKTIVDVGKNCTKSNFEERSDMLAVFEFFEVFERCLF